MINQVLIATTGDAGQATADSALQNRSLLYNKDQKKLFIKYNDELNPIGGGDPDNKNIIEDANGKLALKDIPTVKGIIVQQSGSDNWRGQRLLGNISSAKNIMLFFSEDDANTYIGGELLQKGSGLHGHYDISLTNTGSRSFKGASTDNKKANLIECKYQNKQWYGIKFNSEVSSKVFFSGWYNKSVIVVGGSDVSEVIDLNDNADTGTITITGDNQSIDQIIQDMDNLPETGLDGTPHIIVLSPRVLNRNDLLQISEAAQNSKVQMIIDLSKCSVAPDAQDWGADSNETSRCLDRLFSGCRSIQKFAYPKGVTHAGSFVFQNCASFNQVVFNPEVKYVGLGGWTSLNTGFTQGTSMRELWLPQQYQVLGQSFLGWLFSSSDVLDVYWPPQSWLLSHWTQSQQGGNFFSWGYFAYADRRLRFHMPCHKLPNGQWDLNDGELYAKSQSSFGNFTAQAYNMLLPSTRYSWNDPQFKNICVPYDIAQFDKMKAKADKLY